MKLNTSFLITLNLFVFLFVNFGFAQFGFLYNDSILVKKGGKTLDYPWSGGLNHAQFSTLDANFDGFEDLFIFDRSTDQIRIFTTIQENGIKSYKYLYNSRDLFPKDIRYRATMVDFNDDDKKDIFTGNNSC